MGNRCRINRPSKSVPCLRPWVYTSVEMGRRLLQPSHEAFASPQSHWTSAFRLPHALYATEVMISLHGGWKSVDVMGIAWRRMPIGLINIQ